MCLNHPKSIPPTPLVHGKILFHDISPGCQKSWELLLCEICPQRDHSLREGQTEHGHPTPFSSIQFSRSGVSDSLWSHGLQHARLPCPLPTPGACSNSCPSNQWCRPTISSSVIPFSSCLQSFPASGSFPVSQFFTLGGQSNGVSASTSVLSMNIQDWFPLGQTGLISLHSKGLSRVFSNTTVQKHQILQHSAFFIVQLSHPHPSVPSSIWVRPPREQDVVTLHSSHAGKWTLGSLEEFRIWKTMHGGKLWISDLSYKSARNAQQ